MPAFNAERTLEQTVLDVDRTVVDDIVLVDDCSSDRTYDTAVTLGLHVLRHERNAGYGANQKTCYRTALGLGADIVVMIHPDYQYTPKLVPSMASMIATGLYDVVLGSRILGGTALKGGMPLYKYCANRALTLIQNIVTGRKLSEYHTGLRAFSRTVLETLPLGRNSDDFVFDNQVLLQVFAAGFRIGEISCPTRYFPEASSIHFSASVKYGCACLLHTLRYALRRWAILRPAWLDLRGPGPEG